MTARGVGRRSRGRGRRRYSTASRSCLARAPRPSSPRAMAWTCASLSPTSGAAAPTSSESPVPRQRSNPAHRQRSNPGGRPAIEPHDRTPEAGTAAFSAPRAEAARGCMPRRAPTPHGLRAPEIATAAYCHGCVLPRAPEIAKTAHCSAPCPLMGVCWAAARSQVAAGRLDRAQGVVPQRARPRGGGRAYHQG
eukprot:4976487-Prymnesium_polylepis.2